MQNPFERPKVKNLFSLKNKDKNKTANIHLRKRFSPLVVTRPYLSFLTFFISVTYKNLEGRVKLGLESICC